jgi:hypothetical protein
LSRNAQKHDKKNRTKQPREKKKAAFFVMSRDGLFRKKKVFFRVFELPLLRNAQKTPLKKIDKNKNKNKNKIKQVTTFFLALRQMYVAFVIFVFTAPLGLASGIWHIYGLDLRHKAGH